MVSTQMYVPATSSLHRICISDNEVRTRIDDCYNEMIDVGTKKYKILANGGREVARGGPCTREPLASPPTLAVETPSLR